MLALGIHAGAALYEHREMLDAIVARDEERAETLARVHHCRDKELRLRQMAGMTNAADMAAP